MQIQPIITSQPSYKGRVFYSGEYFLTAKWNKYMPAVLKDIEHNVEKMLADKPFDLYLLRSRDKKGFIQVAVNTNYANIISEDSAKRPKRQVFVNEAMPVEMYLDAIGYAIKEFEDFLKNKSDKEEGFLTRVINIYNILRERKG